jgi:hypothetical protein
MRKQRYWLSILAPAAVLLILPITGFSQNREKFVISAKAGGINAVTGRASVHGKGASEWQQLTITEDLEAGDVVKTDWDGRVEMLLNPGSFLRVGENSEFELANNSMDNLEVRLLRGTAVVEATGADDTELLINITTPDTRMAIVRRGLYRVNVVPGDGTELIVRKGRVMLGDSHTKIKGGNKVVFSSGNVSVAKLLKEEKKKLDALDSWSKERAETVARANRNIRNRDLRVLMAGFDDSFAGFSSRSRGLWYFNTRLRCYTFLPFYMGWGSPYGNSYSSALFSGYFCCGGQQVYGGGGGYGAGNGVGSGSGIGSGGGSGRGMGTGNISQPTPAPMPREMPAAVERKLSGMTERPPNR